MKEFSVLRWTVYNSIVFVTLDGFNGDEPRKSISMYVCCKYVLQSFLFLILEHYVAGYVGGTVA